MPLMMGDWTMGTRGMKAQVKGVYIDLLIHQYDNGFIPSDMEELSLIVPEVGLVWDKLSVKFELFEPGKLRNDKLERVRAFWEKQGANGSKGGRPPKEKPKQNPNNNPNTNHHNDLDNEYDLNDELVKEGVQGKPSGFDDDTRVLMAKKIMADFGFNEIRNPDKLRDAFQFVNLLNHTGRLQYFAGQYNFYFEFKRVSGQEKHKIGTFMGTASEKYEDGGWNAANWEEKLKEHNGKQSTTGTRAGREQSVADYKAAAERVLAGGQP